MRVSFALLTFGALSLSFLAWDAASTRADHTGGPMQAMSIDMNEEATPANTSSVLGTRETCARINENNALDADEDVIDGLLIDVTAQGIPPYHDSGTPNDPPDDTGGISAYGLNFNYSSINLTVQALEHDDPSINILARNPGSSIILVSDPTPHPTGDQFNTNAIDNGTAPVESGSGVLVRLTLVTDTAGGPIPGSYPLTLSEAVHLDAVGAAYEPVTTNNASVAINVPCGDTDGDGVPDTEDQCPTIPGPPSNNGCPPPGPPAVGGTAGLVEADEHGKGSPRNLLAFAGVFAAAGLGAVISWRLLKQRIPLR